MNKKELVAQISETTGLSLNKAEAALNAIIGTVETELAKGGDVTLVGFGKFSLANRAARKGRNPTTGESIDIPSRKLPTFKAGETLRKACK